MKLDFNTGQQFLFVGPGPRMESDEARADAKLAMTPEFRANGFSSVILRAGRSSDICFDKIADAPLRGRSCSRDR